MKISYKKLWIKLSEKEIGISPGTLTKLNKGDEVSMSVLLRICDYLDCDIGHVCEFLKE